MKNNNNKKYFAVVLMLPGKRMKIDTLCRTFAEADEIAKHSIKSLNELRVIQMYGGFDE